MPDYTRILTHLYPDGGWAADDTGILAWDRPEPQPTEAEMAAAEADAVLGETRASALMAIDTAAEAVRLRYITPGDGQALTYLQKEADALAYRDAGYPSALLASYPWVNAERLATAVTGAVAADSIIATADAWRVKAVQIEQERRAGKVAVEAAADVAAIEAARDAALVALDAL